jgi:hypothetical protein
MHDPLKLGHRLVLGKPLNSISCQEYVMGICQVQQLVMLIFQTKLDVLLDMTLSPTMIWREGSGHGIMVRKRRPTLEMKAKKGYKNEVVGMYA